MKTQQEVYEAVKNGRQSGCHYIDRRDYMRLVEFFPVEQWEPFGFGPVEGTTPPPPKPWTREAILEQLAKDLSFGFEKAIDQRGISASLMYEVVKMWMWVLDDPLQDMTAYAQYGLPLFKLVAEKYNLPNPIGADTGNESKYEEQG